MWCDIIEMHLFESPKLRGSPQQKKRPYLRDGSFWFISLALPGLLLPLPHHGPEGFAVTREFARMMPGKLDNDIWRPSL